VRKTKISMRRETDLHFLKWIPKNKISKFVCFVDIQKNDDKEHP
jgi:hypothetical protein